MRPIFQPRPAFAVQKALHVNVWRKAHLTARQAGSLAREAGARVPVPFHFSPRYAGRESELRAEAQDAFGGVVA